MPLFPYGRLNMKNQKFEVKKEEIKEVELIIYEVEDESVIVNVDGWRIRLHFDKGVNKENFRVGQSIIAEYKGDIGNVHSIRFEKLK